MPIYMQNKKINDTTGLGVALNILVCGLLVVKYWFIEIKCINIILASSWNIITINGLIRRLTITLYMLSIFIRDSWLRLHPHQPSPSWKNIITIHYDCSETSNGARIVYCHNINFKNIGSNRIVMYNTNKVWSKIKLNVDVECHFVTNTISFIRIAWLRNAFCVFIM